MCLVRGDTIEAATQRVRKALSARGLEASPERYSVSIARLGKTSLGMERVEYDRLAQSADLIIHVSRNFAPNQTAWADLALQAAWAVHFGSGLDSFENDHIRGKSKSQSIRHIVPLTYRRLQERVTYSTLPSLQDVERDYSSVPAWRAF